jgi:crotonobetainyl-CoA:carnitine CoA-transferase CaiB-like acyl-CoA transferase
MSAPLAGLRVLEVGNWMAAPGTAAMMADLGADVVKVEPLSGDPVRGKIREPQAPNGSGPVDASFQMDNRGKRGVAIAINKPEGADLVRRLAAETDVFINNLLAGRQRRFGLDADTLLALNPRLVHCTLTGYGLEGPDAERPGYDITAFFGRGGITHHITEPGDWAPRARPAVGDHTTSLAALASILAGLRLVDQTGQGQVVDVNLFATATWVMATDLASTLVDGENPQQQGRRYRRHALHEAFRCADGRWILLFMPEPHWWPRFAAVVGRPEWVDDPRMATVESRTENMPYVTDQLDEVMATRPLAEWCALFDEAGLIWAPASTVAEVADNPHAAALGLFPEVEHPTAGRLRTVGTPLRIRGADIAPRGPAPEVGQHTRAVLAGLGIDDDEVDALAAAGIVADAQARAG